MGEVGRCPDCDRHGYLERLDLANEHQTEVCHHCGARWSTRFCDLEHR